LSLVDFESLSSSDDTVTHSTWLWQNAPKNNNDLWFNFCGVSTIRKLMSVWNDSNESGMSVQCKDRLRSKNILFAGSLWATETNASKSGW